jgi:hypothetical protein
VGLSGRSRRCGGEAVAGRDDTAGIVEEETLALLFNSPMYYQGYPLVEFNWKSANVECWEMKPVDTF